MKKTNQNNGLLKTAGEIGPNGIEIIRFNDIRPTEFCVIGERCSGTNLAQHLVRKHLKISYQGPKLYGWKHGFPNSVSYPQTLLCIVLFRDPEDWLRSLYRKPWHTTEAMQHKSFSEFIRHPWDTVAFKADNFGLPEDDTRAGRPLQYDRHPLSGLKFETPLELRNTKNRAFLGMRNREVNVAFVRMEEMVADPWLFLTCLGIAFNLPTPRKVTLPTEIMGGFDRKIPQHSLAPKNLNKNDKLFIQRNLNEEQENIIGYNLGM